MTTVEYVQARTMHGTKGQREAIYPYYRVPRIRS